MELETRWAHGVTTKERISEKRELVPENINTQEPISHRKRRYWRSDVSLWCGLGSVVLFPFSILQILAIVFGILALTQNKPPRTVSEAADYIYSRWYAWAGIVLGVLFLIVRIVSGASALSMISSL